MANTMEGERLRRLRSVNESRLYYVFHKIPHRGERADSKISSFPRRRVAKDSKDERRAPGRVGRAIFHSWFLGEPPDAPILRVRNSRR